MIFLPFAKNKKERKAALSLVCNKSAHKINTKNNAWIYHEQTSERAELHVRAVRVVQSVDVRHSRRWREMVKFPSFFLFVLLLL